ncbi:MAG: hypothetical protein H6742_20380 [Alphaproteobacteria bacterium]|nr:hypothetical protein [Alphaproteobacteria bacterium]
MRSLLLLPALLACATTPDGPSGEPPSTAATPAAAAPAAAAPSAGPASGNAVEQCDPAGSAPIEVSAARIDGDALVLELAHSGGCGSHGYRLCWDGAIAESDPGQARLEVLHDAGGDMCEAWLSSTQTFSLAPLGVAKGDQLVLSVHGQSVTYAP